MTKDGSRWDENGIDRIKFPWEKADYEVPEIHQTPAMVEAAREAERWLAIESGMELPEKAHDVDKWVKSYVHDWSDVTVGSKAWEILEDYYPTPEEEEGMQRSQQRQTQLEMDDLTAEARADIEVRTDTYSLQVRCFCDPMYVKCRTNANSIGLCKQSRR
eukprot:scaffold137164_cov26-Prasinocladus_malaysianus.AAC.1